MELCPSNFLLKWKYVWVKWTKDIRESLLCSSLSQGHLIIELPIKPDQIHNRASWTRHYLMSSGSHPCPHITCLINALTRKRLIIAENRNFCILIETQIICPLSCDINDINTKSMGFLEWGRVMLWPLDYSSNTKFLIVPQCSFCVKWIDTNINDIIVYYIVFSPFVPKLSQLQEMAMWIHRRLSGQLWICNWFNYNLLPKLVEMWNQPFRTDLLCNNMPQQSISA